jgi:signal transduction histidine kinase
MTPTPVARRVAGSRTLRSRVAVLAALVAVLTVISGIAFVVVATHTETAVTQQNQRRLADVVATLVRDYSTYAAYQARQHEVAPLGAPADAGSDAVLTAMTTATFGHETGVEGGFYARATDQLLGYAFPTHDGPGVKRDIPPIERPLIEDVARHATQDGLSTAFVFRGPRDVIVFDAAPVMASGATVGSVWAMKRLSGLRSESSTSVNLGVAAFAAASLLCVGLAYALARGVRRGVSKIEDRLQQLERDLEAQPPQGFAGLEELARIHEGIDRLATSLRDRIASEHALRQALEHKERLAAVGQVAAGVAHELRNPLATIRLRTQMVGRVSTDEDVQRSVAMVLEEIARLDEMVGRLLSFSRPIALRLRRVDVADLIGASLVATEEAARAAGVAVTAASFDSGLAIVGDLDRLRQVLDNVLGNAIEATPDGGRVTISARTVGDEVVVAVEDQGDGVSKDVADRVFDPFFTTKPAGTGLGLSIAYEIVHAHEGRLEIANARARGAIVSVWLPARGPRAYTAAPSATARVSA